MDKISERRIARMRAINELVFTTDDDDDDQDGERRRVPPPHLRLVSNVTSPAAADGGRARDFYPPTRIDRAGSSSASASGFRTNDPVYKHELRRVWLWDEVLAGGADLRVADFRSKPRTNDSLADWG
jgi:hypothetical protein